MANSEVQAAVDDLMSGGAATLMTAASWLLQRLRAVIEEQRPDLVRTLGEARDLVVEVHCRPSIILVRDGDRPLVKLAARPARGSSISSWRP